MEETLIKPCKLSKPLLDYLRCCVSCEDIYIRYDPRLGYASTEISLDLQYSIRGSS